MDEKSKLENLNISKKYNYFIWMQSKCGSTHATNIFRKFEDNSNVIHSDIIDLFDGHWSYDLIALQRNPYTRYVSMFNNLQLQHKINGHEKSNGLSQVRNNFNSYLNSIFQSELSLKNMLNYHKRTPDYFIKIEDLFNDYSKIPFVRKTDFYKSGQLEIECSIPKNESKQDGFSWEELYTPQTSDLVYYNMSLIFDLCDYDKDSWKS
jgi:hypothetical protein